MIGKLENDKLRIPVAVLKPTAQLSWGIIQLPIYFLTKTHRIGEKKN
jgi:hypothetical protein